MLPCKPAIFNPDLVIKSLKSSVRIHGRYGCVELEICNKFESWSSGVWICGMQSMLQF